MAVTDVGFLSKHWKVSVNDRGVRETTYTKVYKVTVNDPDTSEDEIINDSDLPDLFDPYDTDFTARLRSKTPAYFNPESRLVYTVTCEWSTLTPPEEQAEDEDPLASPVQRSVSTMTQAIPATTDRDGNPIVNILNEAYDPSPEYVRFIDVVTFVRNEPNYTLAHGRAYKGKVNSVAILSETAATVLCADISAENITNHDPPYWRVTYVFHIDPNGWQPKILEASWHVVYDSSDGPKLVRATDNNGEKTAMPIPISTTTGQALLVDPDDPENSEVPEYTTWNIYDEVDFKALGLPFE